MVAQLARTTAPSASAALTYRAFLSYAHADRTMARWLHGALEGFRLETDLAARATLAGPVDNAGRARLAPIFLDRGNFAGGHSLTEATLAALDQSAVLIVLCSPVAAGRPAVQEEVRLFKQRHPGRPVVPVIIDGTPPDCFPPAVRFALHADGSVGDEPIGVLGVDVREAADGRALGLAKIVTTLLGLTDANDVFRREERRRRQVQRRWIAGLGAVALGLAGLTVWAEVNRREAVAQRELAELAAAGGGTQLRRRQARGRCARVRHRPLAAFQAGHADGNRARNPGHRRARLRATGGKVSERCAFAPQSGRDAR